MSYSHLILKLAMRQYKLINWNLHKKSGDEEKEKQKCEREIRANKVCKTEF